MIDLKTGKKIDLTIPLADRAMAVRSLLLTLNDQLGLNVLHADLEHDWRALTTSQSCSLIAIIRCSQLTIAQHPGFAFTKQQN